MSTLATLSIESDTGLSRDTVVWSFGIQHAATSLPDAALPQIESAFIQFLGTTPPQVPGDTHQPTRSVSQYLSPTLKNSVDGVALRLYDLEGHLDGSAHGSPFHTRTFQLPAAPADATPLPSEVAIAVTLEAIGRAGAAVESGVGGTGPTGRSHPRARRTGRVFIGPLNNQAVENVGGVARPGVTTMKNLLASFVQLDAALRTALNELDLAVWSRADAAMRAVEAISVDNAFDTQRSRGERSTQRLRYAVAEV